MDTGPERGMPKKAAQILQGCMSYFSLGSTTLEHQGECQLLQVSSKQQNLLQVF